jgi:hypothetical protein
MQQRLAQSIKKLEIQGDITGSIAIGQVWMSFNIFFYSSRE